MRLHDHQIDAIRSVAEQVARVVRVAGQQLVARLDELRTMAIDDITAVDRSERHLDALGAGQSPHPRPLGVRPCR